MARRWLHTVDVETDENGSPLVEKALKTPTSLAGGTKNVASAATPEPLVAEAAPCRFVWLGAPVDGDGVAVNTKCVFVGDADNQNIPLMPSNFEGVVVQIDDASKLYLKAGVNGEGLAYRIFA